LGSQPGEGILPIACGMDVMHCELKKILEELAIIGVVFDHQQGDLTMKKSRGGRMTAAKARAAKRKGGKGPVSKRKAGRKIMKT